MTSQTVPYRGASAAPSAARSWLLPDEPRARYRLYIAVAILLYVAAWAVALLRVQVKGGTIDFARSDAIGYYAYLPSLIIDGDLYFQDQIEVQFRGEPPEELAIQMRKNRWPVGVALSIAPAFFAAHVVTTGLHTLTGAAALAPNGYTVVYFVFCVAWAMGIGTLGMIVADRLFVARFAVPGRLAAAAVLTYWLGTNYVWYFAREPLVTHMIGASWIIFAAYLVHRIDAASRGAPRQVVWWHWPALAFVTSMALACRLTNAFILPLFAYLFVLVVSRGLLWRVAKLAPLILVATLPLVIQFMVVRLITGQFAHSNVQEIGYRSFERFYWEDPALLRILISSRHGLFFWTPVLLFAIWGLVWHMVRRGGWRDGFVMGFVLSALVLWYVNSAWYAWWFGHSMGNRGFLELTALFVIGLGLGYTWLDQQSGRVRAVVVAGVALCFLFNYALIGLKMIDKIEGNEYLIPSEENVFTGRWERI